MLFKKIEEGDPIHKAPKKVPSFPRHSNRGEKEKEADGGGVVSPTEGLPRYKSHSTATNFAASTISKPDLNQVLWWYVWANPTSSYY